MAKTTPADHEGAVPAHATAVVDLLNSRAYANLADKLDHPQQATAVLAAFGPSDGVPPAQRLDLVRAVRADLLNLIAANDPADSAGDWAAFTGRVSSITFQPDFSTPGQVRLRQADGDRVVGRIIQDVAKLVGEGSWSRLKFCANEVCREVFYDTTRNRGRRWHSYEYCGNRTNVAAYRARTTG